MAWIIDELFGFANRFVFANVVCYAARKRLPSGENAHCTVKPAGWWIDLLKGIAAKRPEIVWEFVVGWRDERASGPQFVETTITSRRTG
jgi:hypothetical protein